MTTGERKDSGERARPACWRRRPAFANFPERGLPGNHAQSLVARFWKFVLAGRQDQHSGRVRSPESSLARFVFCLLALSLSAFAEDQPVSYYHDVVPVFKRNCNGCHRPGKTKSLLDLTSFTALTKGGKHGDAVKAGDAQGSRLWKNITGDEPEMPNEGDPLSREEVAIIERWIVQGAKDDTPADAGINKLSGPPVYGALPSVSALAWSPDGSVIAVSGYHEVLLHSADGERIVGRLVGYSPSISALAFSPDGKLLATAGGATSEYGEIQLWDVVAQKLLRSIRTSNDTVFGVSFSPDGTRVAVGCADKLVRVFAVADGSEVMKCDNHIDWVFGTAFSNDGAHLVSASRDRAVKLIDVASGHLIDDVNRARDCVQCLARHPREDLVVFGDDKGGIRIHKMEPRGGRLAEGDDKENSFVRECERMPGPVHGLAWSADGNLICAACATGEVRLFKAADGKRLASLKGHEGAAFAVAFSPDSTRVATAGYDGRIHLFDTAKGEPIRIFDSVPLTLSAAAPDSPPPLRPAARPSPPPNPHR